MMGHLLMCAMILQSQLNRDFLGNESLYLYNIVFVDTVLTNKSVPLKKEELHY